MFQHRKFILSAITFIICNDCRLSSPPLSLSLSLKNVPIFLFQQKTSQVDDGQNKPAQNKIDSVLLCVCFHWRKSASLRLYYHLDKLICSQHRGWLSRLLIAFELCLYQLMFVLYRETKEAANACTASMARWPLQRFKDEIFRVYKWPTLNLMLNELELITSWWISYFSHACFLLVLRQYVHTHTLAHI